MSGAITIEHRRAGRISVDEADVLLFDGIPGFPEANRFALLEHDEASPFSWLVCLDDADLAFVVTDPRSFFRDYEPELGNAERQRLDLREGDEVVLLAIANVCKGQPTLNLAAPVLVNARSRRGVQAVLADEVHSTPEAIPAPAAPSGEAKDADQIESKPQR